MSIKQTSQEIKTLSGLRHIRTRYGMYIGSNANAYHLYREARDNANDEIINQFATDAWFTLHADGSLSVRDNGRGMPTQVMATADKDRGVQRGDGYLMPMARAAIAIPNTGSHYEDAHSVSAGTNGVGAKAITALSDWVELRIWSDGKSFYDRLEFDETTGEPGAAKVALTSKGAYRAQEQDGKNLPDGAEPGYHGTEIRFLPSEDCFENATFDYDFIVHDLTRLAYLNSQATYHVTHEATGEAVTIHKAGGLREYISDLAVHLPDGHSLITDIHEFDGTFVDGDKTVKAKIAVAWSNGPDIAQTGFTNVLYNAAGGTHVDGFNTGIAKLMNDYARKFNLAKDTIEQRDLRPGMLAVISILHTAPTYSSQTKDQLSDTFAKQAVTAVVKEQGMFCFDRAIGDVEKVIKQALARAADRKKFSDLSSIKVETKENKAAVSKKLKPAKRLRGERGVQSAEIFIVEGDSAAGSLVRMRLNDNGLFQAVFPLRGKIINALKTTPDRLFKNTEIATIVTALGCGIGAKYDEAKLKYDKVIIATDADPDGSNISMLLQAFFFEYMPKLIQNGHLYRVMTPLYENVLRGGGTVLAYNDAEQDAIVEKHGKNIVETLRNKGLGEIGDEKTGLWMNTPGTRRLYRYVADDFDNATENMQLLMGTDVPQRREFLMENAEFAKVED